MKENNLERMIAKYKNELQSLRDVYIAISGGNLSKSQERDLQAIESSYLAKITNIESIKKIYDLFVSKPETKDWQKRVAELMGIDLNEDFDASKLLKIKKQAFKFLLKIIKTFKAQISFKPQIKTTHKTVIIPLQSTITAHTHHYTTSL